MAPSQAETEERRGEKRGEERRDWAYWRDGHGPLHHGLAGLGDSLDVAEADGGEQEFGDLEGVEVGAPPCLHVSVWQEVVAGEHAEHQWQAAALQEVVLEVAGVLTQRVTGRH